MAQFQSGQQIEKTLRALGELLDASGSEAIGLLVCGGASLIIGNLVARGTRDVDVLTFFGPERPEQGDLRRHDALPGPLKEAADAVAADFGLDPNWLNIGPAGLIQVGLPEGLMARAIRRDYGKKLRVFYISRLDQIHLKLYAATGGEERHFQDLKALNPTADELRQARDWVETRLADAVLPSVVRAIIEDLGYECLSDRMP